MTLRQRRSLTERDRGLRKIKGAIVVPEYPLTEKQRAAIAAHEVALAAAVAAKLTATIGVPQ